MGADYLEQDLQMTADSVLVVLHDETLDRTASGEGCAGPVRSRTAAELAGCEAGAWFDTVDVPPETPGTVASEGSHSGARIPTLDSVLTRYAGRARFYIETKAPESSPGMEEALVVLLRRHGLLPVGPERNVVVQSFSEASLRRIAELAPSIPRVQLVRRRESRADLWRRVATVAEYGHGLGPAAEDVDAAFVSAAHARCLEVHPYTVNEPREMRRLLEAGVDGIFTDRPDLLSAVRDAAPLAPDVRRWECPR
jgi:glycerophosphoryl diester phosphodiesterase